MTQKSFAALVRLAKQFNRQQYIFDLEEKLRDGDLEEFAINTIVEQLPAMLIGQNHALDEAAREFVDTWLANDTQAVGYEQGYHHVQFASRP